MSRIGKRPIIVPDNVKLKLDSNTITIEGPKGSLSHIVTKDIKLKTENNKLIVEAIGDSRDIDKIHGLERNLIYNMIIGVSQGFAKELEIIGIGYKAEVTGDQINLNLGYSHPVNFKLPKGINAKVEKLTKISIFGYDKQLVGEVAAKIRALRPPEPYKGKGIIYIGEKIRRKVGKAVAGAGAGTGAGAGGGGAK